MANSKAKKSAKKKDLKYAYRVRFHQWDEVHVEKLQILKSTKEGITYISEYSAEFTDVKRGPSHRWFQLRSKAKAFAKSILKSRIEFYEDLISKMAKQSKRLERTIPM